MFSGLLCTLAYLQRPHTMYIEKKKKKGDLFFYSKKAFVSYKILSESHSVFVMPSKQISLYM